MGWMIDDRTSFSDAFRIRLDEDYILLWPTLLIFPTDIVEHVLACTAEPDGNVDKFLDDKVILVEKPLAFRVMLFNNRVVREEKRLMVYMRSRSQMPSLSDPSSVFTRKFGIVPPSKFQQYDLYTIFRREEGIPARRRAAQEHKVIR